MNETKVGFSPVINDDEFKNQIKKYKQKKTLIGYIIIPIALISIIISVVQEKNKEKMRIIGTE